MKTSTPLYNTKAKQSKKQVANRRRHSFLLTFFDDRPIYQVRHVNGYVLVKQYNADISLWEVAIWEKSSWIKAEIFKEKHKNSMP